MTLLPCRLATSFSVVLLLLGVLEAGAVVASAAAPAVPDLRQEASSGAPRAAEHLYAPGVSLHFDGMLPEQDIENPDPDVGAAQPVFPPAARLRRPDGEERGSPSGRAFPSPVRYHLYCVLRI
jgi:hypothetical protein